MKLLSSFFFLAVSSTLLAEETVLQYFNTSWREIERRLPEVAEAGYAALWLPPPTKGGSGTYSVGYDVFDRFDLGDKDQSGTVRTRYGTKAELLSLVEVAHRFGVRIYFDNVMAHNAGPLDNVPPGTLFPGIPGFVPEDFHLVRKVGGGWRKASDSVDYNDEWQVLNRNPFAWDIAYEDPNTSFDPVGQTENADYPKWVGIRHPGKHALYPDTDLTVATNGDGQAVHPFANKEPYVDSGYGVSNTGAGNGKFDWLDANSNGQHEAGETSEPFTDTGVDPTNPARQTATWGFGNNRYDMGNIVPEDVNTMVIRSIRWQIDQTNCDGFRLDAVKHVPNYFFGLMSGANKDRSSAGLLGRAQEQFNITRGFTDWDNHRDTNFDHTLARNDLVLFGEHLGAPPNPDDYINAGMRLANDDFANGVGNGIGGNLSGYDNPGAFTKGVNAGMMYTLSHDNNYMAGSERPAAHQYMLMRAGLPIVYTDGYNVSGAPDYFPKPSYVPFLGQYGQNYITSALRVRRDFVRGSQFGRWSSQNFAAWEFRDKSENASMNDADGTTLVVLMARNYTSGQGQPPGFSTTLATNTILRNYSNHGGSFYAYVGNDGKIKELDGNGNFTANQVIVPSNGYFAFAPPVPEATLAFEGSTTVRPITIQQNGVDCELMNHTRVDGKNGDPAYTHTVQIPRVTSATNLTILGRGDGSVANMLLKLDGGMDVNSQLNLGPLTGTKRDNPPDTAPADAKGMELFVGYEQMEFERRMTEKFAAQDITRVIIGSPGAETWEATIGSSGFVLNQADPNGVDTNTDTAQWLLHNPTSGHGLDATLQMSPPPLTAIGQPINFVVKVGYLADALGSVKIYYTTDGTTYPEGSGNKGRGSTQVVNFAKIQNATAEAGGTPEWWRATIPALPAGTKLRYKIGGYKNTAATRYPSAMDEVRKKERMETIYRITGFNADTVTYYPHSDKGTQATGLKEGLHALRTRSFLTRNGKASLYKTNTQTFYLDQQAPQGIVKFPANNGDTIGGTSYGFVVLSDAQTTEVWYQILDTNGTTTWAKATEVNPAQQTSGTAFTKEWRFTYTNIPSSGVANIKVRFKELSSAADNNLTDAVGWFTTVTRTLNTGHPANFRIAYPSVDGTVISNTYQMKIYFDKSLGYNGAVEIPPTQILNEISIYLASEVSGEADGALLQPRASYGFIRNETATESAVTFTFPNLYNGDPNWLHHVRAEHQRGAVTLSDTRLVKAAIAAIADVDGDGLPDFWENAHGLDRNSPDGDQGAQGDPDFDGVTNLEEYLFALSPITQDRIPTLGLSRTGNTLAITFPLLANRRYRLMTSTGLTGWQPIGTYTTVGSAQNFTWNVNAAEARRFYQVEVSLP